MEKVQDERFTTKAMAKFEKYGSGEVGDLYMKNLSKSGALFSVFTSRVNFSRGDLIRFVVTLKDIGRERVVNAEVIWSRGGEIGVNFVNPEEIWNRLVARN